MDDHKFYYAKFERERVWSRLIFEGVDSGGVRTYTKRGTAMSPINGIVTKPEPYCPECGGRMVLRRPDPGQIWDPFWGCSQYPDCRGKLAIDPETGKPESDDFSELDLIDD